jgi:hypothetical protein
VLTDTIISLASFISASLCFGHYRALRKFIREKIAGT